MASTVDSAILCPVCGYDLGFPPWQGESPSDEFCPSCGMQFGNYDATEGDCPRSRIYQAWRDKWIQDGAKWWSSRPRPTSWDPSEQLLVIGVGQRHRLAKRETKG